MTERDDDPARGLGHAIVIAAALWAAFVFFITGGR